MSSGGFSRARLGRMQEVMGRSVERGEVAGLVTLLCRRGEVHVDAIGARDLETGAPMRRDTIFRIASMTKPVTAAAAMILVEEGKLRLDDPVDPWLPELADRKVLRDIGSPLDDTVPAERPITLRDLLTLRLGIGAVMSPPGTYPIQQAMEEARVDPGPAVPALEPDEWMRRLGDLPLIHQPGERWMYHTGFDILNVLLARASGMPLEDFLTERLFAPLGMKDTGFRMPDEKLDRLATCYQRESGSGRLVPFDDGRSGRENLPPVFASELFSTADDYLAFGRMMLSRGRHEGTRILARPTVEVMITDQITPEQKAASPFFPGFWDNLGWGFGVSVITRRDGIAAVPGRFGWDGGFGTSWSSDPHEEMVSILMMQCSYDPVVFGINTDFWTLAYQAVDD